MPRDPRIDAYIEKAPEFARPILEQIRETVHAAVPEVQETLKWSMPFFEYHGILCGMGAFKAHAVFGFWKGKLIDGVSPNRNAGGEAMGNFGKLASVKDLPPKRTLTALIKQAAKLNAEGTAVPKPKRKPRPEAVVPDDLAAELSKAKHRKARTTFEGFAPSHRREYIEWITEAKRDETRARRLAQTLEMLAEGKPRNWKYGA